MARSKECAFSLTTPIPEMNMKRFIGKAFRYGALSREYIKPPLGGYPVHTGVKIKLPTRGFPRKPQSVSLGVNIKVGATLISRYSGDRGNIENIDRGIRKRFARPVGGIGGALRLKDLTPELRRIYCSFRNFVRKFLNGREGVPPLSIDAYRNELGNERERVLDWIENSNYPGPRKNELRGIAEDAGYSITEKALHSVGSFIKDETYDMPKEVRVISSRNDRFKCYFGPFIKAVEKRIYKLPFFFKNIKEEDKIKTILDRMDHPGARFMESDYTSYEASFHNLLMQATSGELYRHFYRRIPVARKIMATYMKAMVGLNRCRFRNGIHVAINAVRMTGELDTSLANGFANAMMMKWVCAQTKADIKGMVIEGDDCLLSFTGPDIDLSLFTALGIIIKPEFHTSLNTASFCGLRFNKIDEVKIPDIRKILFNFGWSNSKSVFASDKLLTQLLRSKACSYYHMYSKVPVISALCKYALRCTEDTGYEKLLNSNVLQGWDLKAFNNSIKFINKMDKNRKPDIGYQTRKMVAMASAEGGQGISIAKQLRIEAYLNSQTMLGELCHPDITSLVSEDVMQYSMNHVLYCGESTKNSEMLMDADRLLPYYSPLDAHLALQKARNHS